HRVEAADSLGDDHQLCAEAFENTDRQRDFFKRVAFVLMEAAFHAYDGNAFEAATDEAAAVAGGGGFREVRDVAIVERGGNFDFLDEAAKAGAEDDAGVRCFAELGLDGRGGGFDLVVEVEHAT